MSWSNIINQARVKDILQNSLMRNRLAHAYLFSGPAGVGKFATALELAKAINCEFPNGKSCGKCNSCLKFQSLQHPNLNLIFAMPVGKNEKSGDTPLSKLSEDDIAAIREQIKLKASNSYHTFSIEKANNIKISSIREIRRTASLTAFNRGKKVYIIIDAEKMTDEASNALLKTLEEPSDDTILILTTAFPDALLPTIVSRCQHIRFDLLSDETVRDSLIKREGMDFNKAREIAQLSRGSYAKALQYSHSDLFEHRTAAIELLRTMLFKSKSVLLKEIDRIVSDYDKTEIQNIILMIEYWLRDAKILSEGIEEQIDENEKQTLKKFIDHYQDWNYSLAIEALSRSISLIDKNVYIPLIILDLAFKLKEAITAPQTIEDGK